MAKEVQDDKDSKDRTISLLVENSVALQKILATVAINVDSLTKQLSELLKLFRETSKKIEEKGLDTGTKQLDEKLSTVMDQNRTIAKGLLAMESFMAEQKPKPLPEYRF